MHRTDKIEREKEKKRIKSHLGQIQQRSPLREHNGLGLRALSTMHITNGCHQSHNLGAPSNGNSIASQSLLLLLHLSSHIANKRQQEEKA
jgi:hypothetical protein